MEDSPVTYPVNLLLEGRQCLVVGAGRVAVQKTRELLLCGAVVRVVASDISEPMTQLADSLELSYKPYSKGDLKGCVLAIAATGDSEVNKQVFDDGRNLGVLVNSADDPDNCDFYLPARIRQGSLLITVSTSGRSPAMASWLRSRIASQLDSDFGPDIEILLDIVSAVRDEIKDQGISTESLAWKQVLTEDMCASLIQLTSSQNLSQAKTLLKEALLGDSRG